MRAVYVAIALLLGGCCVHPEPGPDTLEARPYPLEVPSDPDGELPLLIYLHGHNWNGVDNPEWLGFDELSERRRFFYAHPTGTPDCNGENIWNVTPDYDNGYDDVAYLSAIIDDVADRHEVGPVFLFGHSMGGALAYRYACELPERVDGVVSLAGTRSEAYECLGASPVPFALAMGDQDEGYDGEDYSTAPAVGARETMLPWRDANGCTGELADTGERMDIDTTVPGDEAVVESFEGCTTRAELWTMRGSTHSVGDFAEGAVATDAVWEWLLAAAQEQAGD